MAITACEQAVLKTRIVSSRRRPPIRSSSQPPTAPVQPVRKYEEAGAAEPGGGAIERLARPHPIGLLVLTPCVPFLVL
jgi:hypothetical protein